VFVSLPPPTTLSSCRASVGSRSAGASLIVAGDRSGIGREFMARLVLNRRWTFILALGLSLVCCALAHHGVYASGERNCTAGGVIVDPGDGGGGAGAGDPDAPVGNGKSPGSGGM